MATHDSLHEAERSVGRSWRISRRELILAGGTTAVAALFADAIQAQQTSAAQVAGTKTLNGGTKPI